MIRDTVDRIAPLVPAARTRVLTGENLAQPILDVLPEFGPDNLLLEPRAAGTAPVLAWAAAELERLDPEAVMVSVHADHIIAPAEAFRQLLREAAQVAVQHRRLVTLGAVPTRPETGYGYVRVGEPLAGGPAHEVDRFVEKPDAETAKEYMAAGDYLWNTGLFIWRASELLDQLQLHTPEIAPWVPRLRAGEAREFFAEVPTLSIDEGLLERSDRVTVLPATFHWDDVGTWDALYRTGATEADGNVRFGDAHLVASRRTACYAEDGPVVAFGVEDLIVVRTGGITFVTHRERAAELKALLPHLPERLRTGS